MDKIDTEHCFKCNKELGLLEPYYLVKEPIKPKGYPNRYETVGHICEDCYSAQ